MSDYTPTVDEVRDRYADGRTGIGEWTRFDESVKRAVEEAYAEFDRMIAEVERAAAAKALEEFADQMTTGFNAGTLNAERRAIKREARARAEAYRQERGEQ